MPDADSLSAAASPAFPAGNPVVVGWARSPVTPHGGALRHLEPHQIAAPVLQGLLARNGIPSAAVDAIILGNALGAGGNPARMTALAAGLPDTCAAYSVDTQCCAGLDAVILAAGLIRAGNADIVIAGGVEAWSRAPLRLRRPLRADEAPQPYERPAFAPDSARDPDLFEAAARLAAAQGYSRARQDETAMHSHALAVQHQASIAAEIISVAGLGHDAHPREINAPRAARMPVAASAAPGHEVSILSISPKADGAALVALASPAACKRLGLGLGQGLATSMGVGSCRGPQPPIQWLGGLSLGHAPEMPMQAAAAASLNLLARHGITAAQLSVVELHDAFAAQTLDFCASLGLPQERINCQGGGLARGHPIGASAAIALVRALSGLANSRTPGALALTATAGAGGLGTAALLRQL